MKKIISILFVLILSGCGSRGTFLDDFLVLGGSSMAQVDQYFDLDSKQHEQLEKNIDTDLDRLRQERFQTIAKSLREIEKTTKNSKDPKIMSSAYMEMRKQYMQASPYFKGSTDKLIASLKEPQLKNFKSKVQKEISDTKSGIISKESLNEELINRYKKGLEFWVGDLTVAQQQSIAQFTRDHPFPWNEKIKNKEAILNQFMAVHENSTEMRKFSERFVSDYPSVRTPEYAVAITAYEKDFESFLDSFWLTLSPEQKSLMQKYLIGRAEKLEYLARGR